MSTQPPKKQPTRRRAKTPAMERVTLDLEHTHLGKKHPPGDEISVHPETARWLRDAGVVSPTTISNKD
ncbi:hypothetical protein [Hydrogenophaga taeniospiralis]|uniref:DUF7210 family protein n=1 Tax=Hydrogenophaga taeniospiralis TaxID=65656 RepID=UPI001CF9C9F7|nr:hypothetical protein [Hydrogenophaga taeniospiralis]UCU92690.1 hypothetical protein KI616_17900 [Hydrogenophaga taeniospiralis]